MSEEKPEAYKKLIAILGPTSSGKSSLAIEMAKRWNGEIVSVDSRQVYRGMDIGTGKVRRDSQLPTSDNQHTTRESDYCKLKVGSWESKVRSRKLEVGGWESEGIPHHLLDVADPNDDYNISHFLRDARVAIEDISHRGKLPIICGGTGFWIQALIENQELPNVPPDPALREELSQKTPEELFELLTTLDPERANTIDRKNPRRLMRAIEIARDPNYKLQITNYKKTERQNIQFLLALCPPKPVLDARIRTRLKTRFNEGMVDEVARLHTEGVSWERLDAFGLEYRSISRSLRNLISERDMKERLLFDIIHYAKRQMTWIRRWHRKNQNLHIVETPEEAMGLAEAFLESE